MKVLIWTKKISLVNKGGPMGYCYNIKSYLDEHPCEEIDFYPGSVCLDSQKETAALINVTLKQRIKKKLVSFLQKNKYTSFALTIYSLYFRKYPLSAKDKELLKKYDFVHVHGSYEILSSFLDFKSAKTKVILTTHTPEPLIDEEIGRFGDEFLFRLLPCIRNFFLKREIKAYNRADLVMFPVPEAREPYINKSQYHKQAFVEIESKTFFVPTAINNLKNAPEKKFYLKKYDIPDDAFKICYVGRHNEVKGYDFLKKIAKKTWEKFPNAYFVIGGTESPMKGLCDSRWIELGWVNTCELLNEVDVFVLPNKETYFDIILLEVLRQGVPVIISKTGGNKWFVDKGVAGIHCVDYADVEGGAVLLQQLYVEKKNGRLELQRKANMEFFEKKLYMANYIENYLMSLKKILK